MPPIEEQDRHQKAVLWMASGTDNYGQTTVDAAVAIEVRWRDTQSETMDTQGNKIAIVADVVVDRAITPGSIMWKGDIADLPSSPTDLKRVVSYVETPDIKGREFRRSVKLERFCDSLPAIV